MATYCLAFNCTVSAVTSLAESCTIMDYQPINCDFYDILEALAVRQIPTKIEYLDEGGQTLKLAEVVIKDLYTKQKEEFMLLNTGQVIRLDKLLRVHDTDLPGSCAI